MDKRKELQALDDDILDQVSGGIELTPLIHKEEKKNQKATANSLVYRGEKVHMGGLVWHSGTAGNSLTMNNLTVQNTGTQEDEDNVLIPM